MTGYPVHQDTQRPCQGTTEKGLEPLLTESESAVLPITPFRIISSEQTIL